MFRVMCRFSGRVIEYRGMYVVIFTVMFTFVLFSIFSSVKYFLTESELNKVNKYIYF